MKKTKIIIIFIVGILVGAGALFAWNLYMVKNPAKASSQVEQNQIKDIIEKVGKLIILPTREDPIIATINDAATLIEEQPFYIGAKNGDIVLIYQKTAKAIVYSSDRNLIINVGPIVPQPLTQPPTSATSTIKKK